MKMKLIVAALGVTALSSQIAMADPDVIRTSAAAKADATQGATTPAPEAQNIQMVPDTSSTDLNTSAMNNASALPPDLIGSDDDMSADMATGDDY